MKEIIKKIYDECTQYAKLGQVADYIPELAKVDKNLFGACIVTNNGDIYGVGDYQYKFSIQSVSKISILIQAMIDNGWDELEKKVTFEPTSSGFNSITNLEIKNDHRPLNPCLNAGAIVTVSFIKGNNAEEKVTRLLKLIKAMTGNDDIKINQAVFESEKATGSRNRALAYFMHSTGTLEGNVEEILKAYFMICSIEVTCEDLAKIALTIANNGTNRNGENLFDAGIARKVRTVMALCGMYNESGDFAIRVGMPSKSGVGGGIMSVSLKNGGMGVATFGPSLDKIGNSYCGKKFMAKLSTELDLSIF